MPDGKNNEDEGRTGGTAALTLRARAWDFSKRAVKAVLVWSLAFFAVAGVTAITVFFVLQGGAAWGVPVEWTNLAACISGLVMFVAYAASWGRGILETYGYLPYVPSSKAPDDVEKKVKRHAVSSYLLSFTAAALIAFGAYLGFVVFAAAFGLPMLTFQILGGLSGFAMTIVLGDFLDYLQRRKNYKDQLMLSEGNTSQQSANKKYSKGKLKLFAGLSSGGFIAVMAAVGFGVFKAFPINDFLASMGLATGELLIDLTLVGALIITVSSFLSSTWAIWNVVKAWSQGKTLHSHSEYPPPTTLLWRGIGGFFVWSANILNSMGPVISIFIFVTAFTPAAPVTIFLWVMAGIFFVARAIDFELTNGDYMRNTFRKTEEWFGMGKSASNEGYMDLDLVTLKEKGISDAQENTAARAEQEKQNSQQEKAKTTDVIDKASPPSPSTPTVDPTMASQVSG